MKNKKNIIFIIVLILFFILLSFVVLKEWLSNQLFIINPDGSRSFAEKTDLTIRNYTHIYVVHNNLIDNYKSKLLFTFENGKVIATREIYEYSDETTAQKKFEEKKIDSQFYSNVNINKNTVSFNSCHYNNTTFERILEISQNAEILEIF